MTHVLRTKEWATVAQLTQSWAVQLDKEHFEQEEADLIQTICEDMVNGRFDDVGPVRDGGRLGLRFIIEGKGPGFIKGHELRPLLIWSPAVPWVLNRIVVMKEAALDFARRRQLDPPWWWRDDPDLPTGAIAASKGLEPASANGHPESPSATTHSGSTPDSAPAGSMPGRGGRRPRKRNQVKAAMNEDLEQGRLTASALKNMLEKNLAEKYGVSRETARKARNEVLSEMARMSETQFSTKPTKTATGGK
jgi:hypothetical protein